MKIGKIIKSTEDTVYIGYNNGNFQKSAVENCEFEPKIGDIVHIYEDLVVKLEAKNSAFIYKPKHKIIRIEDGLARIQRNTGDELTIPIRELNFQPKLNELVEIYQDADEIIVLRSKEKGINWLLLLSCSLIPIVLISFMFFFNHKKQDKEAVSATTEQVSTTSTTTTSTTSTTTTSSTSATSSQASIIDTTAETLRDMENDGTLKTGQLYRFTAELFRQEDWGDYSGHFSYLNKYYNIKVKASNASIAGIEIHIDKKLTGGWKEGQIVTFTVKIFEDSEKFQYWVVTEATPNTEPSTQKDEQVSEQQEIDAQAILNGDFSTVAGTWRNGIGHEFTFDKKGLVNAGNINKASIGSDGSISFSISTGATGYGMTIYPAGATIKWVDSDLSKNRIIAGQNAPHSSKQVYYKVD
ncbi:DUF6287 domain-containing protein [Streptococcus sp. Marseille-Q4154]|uniref:DUF6287 domain-containing protein n=1 Tax=Streptococcus sp. Marseille-Q4154 TaxID=2866598 RepID=UPI001CE4826D|nr:DUF6287 domain-containing protein [Streptococcus sp. Marseille-Q4154]